MSASGANMRGQETLENGALRVLYNSLCSGAVRTERDRFSFARSKPMSHQTSLQMLELAYETLCTVVLVRCRCTLKSHSPFETLSARS